MAGTGKIVTVKLFECGYCVNDLGHVFKGYRSEKRRFPALAVLLKHSELGCILYDTGYSKLIYDNKLVSKIYNLLNRTYVAETDMISSKLMENEINPSEIKNIILSHAHPDHIAGLKYFRDYELVSTPVVLNTLCTGNAFDLVFKNMIPTSGVKLRALKPYKGSTIFDGYFDRIFDVFGDGSVIGVELNGHAQGQLGIYIPGYELFFAADACWGEDLMKYVGRMRLIPRLIQDSYRQYRETIITLKRFSKDYPGIRIIYSHGRSENEQ